MLIGSCSCSDDDKAPDENVNKEDLTPAELSCRNVERAMELVDNAVTNYFSGDGMAMARYYNPYTDSRSDEKGSVWMYTASIEAVNAILHALEQQHKSGITSLYDANFARYKDLLSSLYDNLDYYMGTYTLTSFTQTKEWSVYGVNRGGEKGGAQVDGILNVYDDQMWLIRELIEAYRVTGEAKYLAKAEYLADYVLDGWDCTLDENGEQNGGIPWGPGYVTKHSCSNGPLVSPLVWLHEIYKGKADEVTYGYIAPDNSRKKRTEKKSDYYLEFAKAVYDYQKRNLFIPEQGVYADMMGGAEGDIAYEVVDGVRYRKNTKLNDRAGAPLSYNSGTMISGGADLYRATGDAVYKTDTDKLVAKSFKYFAKFGATHPGYFTFDINGFNNWFNGVLMRSYVDASTTANNVADCIAAFQNNLDYAYEHHLYKHMLPTNLLVGWSHDKGNNKVEGMFTFTFAAEYAVLAKYELTKN